MSLQSRILTASALVMVLALLMGLGVLLENARRAVRAELESSAHLTLQLLEQGMVVPGQAGPGGRSELVQRIGALQGTRHLCIGLYGNDGRPLVEAGCGHDKQRQAPGWFLAWVASEPVQFRRAVTLEDGSQGTVVVEADPVDEVDEIWRDIRDLAILAGLGFLGVNLLLFLIVRRALRPVGEILTAIEGVAKGRYALQLSEFSLPEFRRIAEGLKQMAGKLERTRRENRALALRSLRIQEQERRFIARELHDELGQSLVAIRADAAYIAKRSGEQSPESARVAGEIMEIASGVYEVVRRLMRRLRPSVLDELGLEAALRQHVQEWNARHPETRCTLRVHGELRLSESRAMAVYRIVQETLTNIAKHASASKVDIELKSGADSLVLCIEDDGRGFDLATVRPSLGLVGMRERAAFVGGEFVVDARPGAGTRVRARIPFKRETAPAARAS